MNNIFSIKRFFWLFGKHTREQYKTYLMSVAVLIGLLSIALGFACYANRGELGEVPQCAFFWICLLFPGTIFTSMIFSDLGDKIKSIPALTLPVSHFERFLVGWLYSFVIFQLVYLACFFTIDLVVLNLGNQNPYMHNQLLHLDSDHTKVYYAFLAFMVLHSMTFFGAIFFKRLHYIKTLFAILLFLIGITLINTLMMKLFFAQEVRPTVPFAGVFIMDHNQGYFIESEEASRLYGTIVGLVMVFLLWAATYFKLKEKQV